MRAGVGERRRGGQPDAAPGPGHERTPAVEAEGGGGGEGHARLRAWSPLSRREKGGGTSSTAERDVKAQATLQTINKQCGVPDRASCGAARFPSPLWGRTRLGRRPSEEGAPGMGLFVEAGPPRISRRGKAQAIRPGPGPAAARVGSSSATPPCRPPSGSAFGQSRLPHKCPVRDAVAHSPASSWPLPSRSRATRVTQPARSLLLCVNTLSPRNAAPHRAARFPLPPCGPTRGRGISRAGFVRIR